LVIVCAVLLVTAYVATKPTTRRADLYYAFDIVESFGDKAARASKGGTSDACDILWELHYPSFEWPGAPHPFQGRLSDFVEGQRRRAIAEVIRYLRAKTSEDLGANPENWLLKYGSQSVKEDLSIMKAESKTNSSNPSVQRTGASRAPQDTNQTPLAAGSRR
jgi:hypothetical protein